VDVRSERTGTTTGCPDSVPPPALAAELPDVPEVAVVRTSRGWSVICPDGAEPVDTLLEGMSLADLVTEMLGGRLEPDRTARRSARGPAAAEADAEDPRDARIAALERTVAQLEHALAARVSTERAIGVLAEREGIAPKAVFDGLRQRARSSGRPVHELAREVLESLAEPATAPATQGRDATVPAPTPLLRAPFHGRHAEHARPRSGAAGDGRS